MQIAGAACTICGKKLLLEAEGTWCARCASVMHRGCLDDASRMCPTCGKAYDPPETHFVISQSCPECFKPNTLAKPDCSFCGARICWDNQAAYDAFSRHMKHTAHKCFLWGMAELAGGMASLLGLSALLYVNTRPSFGLPHLLVLGFMALTADGLLRILRSRQIAKFR